MDQEKEGHVNSFTLAFRDSDKERQYQVEISLTLYGLVCCGYQTISGGSRHRLPNISRLLSPPYPSSRRSSGWRRLLKYCIAKAKALLLLGTMITMMLQALVLPRTTILLLLFLTAFIWIAVSNSDVHLQSQQLVICSCSKHSF